MSESDLRKLRQIREYEMARAGNQDQWVPACGGTEVETTTRCGRRVLYVWNPRQGKHAYLDLNTDMLISDADAMAMMP